MLWQGEAYGILLNRGLTYFRTRLLNIVHSRRRRIDRILIRVDPLFAIMLGKLSGYVLGCLNEGVHRDVIRDIVVEFVLLSL